MPPTEPLRITVRTCAVVLAVTLTGCGGMSSTAESPLDSSSSPSGQPSGAASSPSPSDPADPVGANATIGPIPDTQWRLMEATGTWRPGCPAGRDQLRRIEVNHRDFAGAVQRGVLVAHADVAADLAEIFTELFEAGFPITRMVPAEEYDGDVQRSLAADSTSAFNCRRPDQINAPVLKSPHANGRAIDINPYRNPWRDLRCDCWQPSDDYATTRSGPGVIAEGSLPWTLFTSRGWIWQDIKVPDYMHFDTGFPSVPRPAAAVVADRE